MYKKLSTCYLAIFCVLFLMEASTLQAADKDAGKGIYTVNAIETKLQDNSLLMVLKGNSAPTYTKYELFAPMRIVLDLAETEVSSSIDTTKIMPKNTFSSLKVTTLKDSGPVITRFEITLAESHSYKIDKTGNDIAIRLFPKNSNKKVTGTQSNATNVPSLHDMVIRRKGTQTEILFQADQPITNFRQDTKTGRNGLSDSMFIDINNINASELVREKTIGTSIDKIRVATRGSGVRIVFDAGKGGLFSYDITTVPQGLLVTIDEKSSKNNSSNRSDSTLDELIGSSEALATEKTQTSDEDVSAAEAMQDSFEFSGYKAERISVDFYKIDLHNVFRLFREISGINLIVDESVTGSLSLALTNVPWDFALDIILNLKNLQKEERHNTIIIYPADKAFSWPERASENLSFEADTEVIEQEALIIQQSTNQSAANMQANELLRRAKIEEQNDDIEDAAEFYEQAFKLWPKNEKISNRLAALYLVNLKNNAKAVFFAKKSLKLNKKNHQAALYAAIASANMDQVSEAMNYFSQSINGKSPMKEALISYAAFSEEKGQPEAALKLLNRYSDTYSDTVDTMISKARIYDTMGETEKATEQYKTLLYSGYQLVPGLKKYIRGRLTLNPNQIAQ